VDGQANSLLLESRYAQKTGPHQLSARKDFLASYNLSLAIDKKSGYARFGLICLSVNFGKVSTIEAFLQELRDDLQNAGGLTGVQNHICPIDQLSKNLPGSCLSCSFPEFLTVTEWVITPCQKYLSRAVAEAKRCGLSIVYLTKDTSQVRYFARSKFTELRGS
jgi:hypothetical protein